jgi:hypothetical protein
VRVEGDRNGRRESYSADVLVSPVAPVERSFEQAKHDTLLSGRAGERLDSANVFRGQTYVGWEDFAD